MSDKSFAALKPRSKRYVVVDPEMRGAYARIQPSGVKSFWVVTRNPNGKQIWTHVGPASIGIKASREIARDVLQRGKRDHCLGRSRGALNGATPNIPPKNNRRWKPCFSRRLYRERNLIERFSPS